MYFKSSHTPLNHEKKRFSVANVLRQLKKKKSHHGPAVGDAPLRSAHV